MLAHICKFILSVKGAAAAVAAATVSAAFNAPNGETKHIFSGSAQTVVPCQLQHLKVVENVMFFVDNMRIRIKRIRLFNYAMTQMSNSRPH